MATKLLQIHANMLSPYLKEWKPTTTVEQTEIIKFSKKCTDNKIKNNLTLAGQTITQAYC